jgi:hypothetical protein
MAASVCIHHRELGDLVMAKKKSAKKAAPKKKAGKKAATKKAAKKGSKKAAAPTKRSGKKAPAMKKAAPKKKVALKKKTAPKKSPPKKTAPTITGRLGDRLGAAGESIASVARFVAPPVVRTNEPTASPATSTPPQSLGAGSSTTTNTPGP